VLLVRGWLFLVHHRFVYRWVERFAFVTNTLDAQLSQCLKEALAGQENALRPRMTTQIGWQVGQGPVQVVDGRQESA
jgi:hypothetical protein